MKTHLFLVALPLLFLQACKKDKGTDGNPPAGTRLVKETIAEGTNKQTNTYGYAADGKLSSVRQAYTGGDFEEMRISRNAAGLIESIAYNDSDPSQNKTVSVGSSGDKYSFAEWTVGTGTFSYKRKISFVYNGDGRIAEATTVDNYITGPDPKTRETYSYKNNNLATITSQGLPASPGDPGDRFDLEYDDKTNPVAFGADWIVLSLGAGDFWMRASANNVTKLTVTEAGFPPETYNFTYTYTPQNRPATFSFKAANSAQPAATGTYTYE